jgi:hypothetical protein
MRHFIFITFSILTISCEETDKEADGTDLVSDTGTPGVLDPDTGVEEDTSISDECAITITLSNPEPNSDTFFYRDPLLVTLSDMDETANISLRSTSGEDIGDVEGSSSIEGRELSFMPSQPLIPETSYTAYVSTCDAEQVEELSFTTSSFGLPITEPLLERMFGFNFGTGRMEPIEFQASLDGMVQNYILLSALEQNGTRVQFHAGSSVDGDFSQDYCAATSEAFSPVDVEGEATLMIEVDDLPFRSKDQTLHLRDFRFSFTLSPDGQKLTHGYWSAEADMREFSVLLNQGSYDMCNNYFPTFGVSCQPCSVDQDPSCIVLSMYEVEADAIEKNLNCVSRDECHLECANNLPECTDPQAETCD